MKFKKRHQKLLYYYLVLLIIIFLISFYIGRYPVSIRLMYKIILSKVFPLIKDWDPTIETIIFKIRLPRIMGAILIGGGLAVAGSVYQGLFKNPLVSPDILGVSSGAGFGAALAILLSANRITVQMTSFIFGIIAVLLVYVIGMKVKGYPGISLVIIGILISSLFTSLTSLIKYIADSDNKLPTITFWLMGSLADISIVDLRISGLLIILAIVPLFRLRWKLNLLALNEDEASTLGLDTRKVSFIVIVCSTLITAASVSISGIIGWIGLLIPHLTRVLVGPDYRILLPISFILGASYLLVVDNLARALVTIEIPLSIMTSLLGVPIFLIILLRGKNLINDL